MITHNKNFQKKHNLIESNFEDCIMLYDIENGKYYVLNEIASLIWGQLKEGSGVGLNEIANTLSELYTVDVDILNNDMMQFIESMLKNGLILTGE